MRFAWSYFGYRRVLCLFQMPCRKWRVGCFLTCLGCRGVEWMRSAYYDGYGAIVLDKTYLIAFALVTLFFGLALERLVRGKLLGG